MTTRRPSNAPSNRSRTREPEIEAQPASITVSSEPAPETKNKVAPERIGDTLRKAREMRGDDIQQIADYLCIRRNFLVAIENSRYEEFPADAYVIGFLRSYATLLGMDGKDAIDRYRAEMSGRRKKPILFLPTPITEGRTPSAIIMAAAAVAALLIYAVWYGISSSDRSTIKTPPPLPSQTSPAAETIPQEVLPVQENVAPAPPAASSSASSPEIISQPSIQQVPLPAPRPQPSQSVNKAQPAAPAASGSAAPPASGQVYGSAAKDSRLTIRTLQSSWVLITDSKGQTVFDHVMKPGDLFKIPNTEGLTLTTGNGSGVVLTLDGVDLPKLSTGTSHVLRNIPLNIDHLKALPANPDD